MNLDHIVSSRIQQNATNVQILLTALEVIRLMLNQDIGDKIRTLQIVINVLKKKLVSVDFIPTIIRFLKIIFLYVLLVIAVGYVIDVLIMIRYIIQERV